MLVTLHCLDILKKCYATTCKPITMYTPESVKGWFQLAVSRNRHSSCSSCGLLRQLQVFENHKNRELCAVVGIPVRSRRRLASPNFYNLRPYDIWTHDVTINSEPELCISCDSLRFVQDQWSLAGDQ